MKKKHVSIIFVTATSLLGISVGCLTTSMTSNANKKAKGDAPQDSFTIVLDKDNHAITEYGNGSVNTVTAYGNLIHVDYTSTSETADAWATVANGGTIKNAYDSTTYNNQLSGLTSIKVSFSGALTLSYGWVESVSSATYTRVGYKLSSGEVFNFGAECPSYFALKATAETVVTRVELTYSCVKEEEQDVFKIGSYDDLVNYAKLVNGGITGLNAELTNNIDASASSTDGGFIQIGRSGYSGTFDGNGYTITNLTLKEYSGVDYPYNGFISRGGGAKGFRVKDLDIEVSLTETNTSSGRNGLLVAQSWDGAEITDVIVRGSLTSVNAHIGAFMGWAESGSGLGNVFENCVNYATVTSTNASGYAAGFVANTWMPKKEGYTHISMVNCINYGDINGTQFVGGIIGGSQNSCTDPMITTSKTFELSKCKNYGAVTASANYSGGMIGLARTNNFAPLSTIDECENWGSVTSTPAGKIAGGVAGILRGTSVTNSYMAAGNPNRIIRVKGQALTVTNYESTTNTLRMIGSQTSKNTTSAYYYHGSDITPNNDKMFGWLVGQLDNNNNGLVDDSNWCGWYGDTTGHTGFAGGDGTEEHPYEIERASQYVYLRNLLNSDETVAEYANKHYVLTKNIDFDYVPENEYSRNLSLGTVAGSSQSWAFRGTFDGQGYSIRNFGAIKNTEGTSLFANTINATIKNVSLVNPYILGGKADGTAYTNRSGGFSGRSQSSKFNNVHVIGGKIIGKQETGGIAGFSIGDGSEFINCSNSANVTTNGGSNAAGIVGNVYSGTHTISDCSNSGNISSGTSYAGGIVGQFLSNAGSVCVFKDCSNAGDISAIAEGVGGIVGAIGKTLEGFMLDSCSNAGDVTGGHMAIGGIAGETGSGSWTIVNCENTGDVTNTGAYTTGAYVGKFAGGIVGLTRIPATNVIDSCINRGNIAGPIFAGGIVGENRVTITNCKCLASALIKNDTLGDWATFEDAVKTYPNIFVYGNSISGASATGCSLLTEDPKSTVYPFQMGSMQD